MNERPAVDVANLLAVDRDVQRAWRAWEAWRRDLARDPKAYADHEPIAAWRHVAGQRTYEALRDFTPSALDLPLRDGLMRWVATLTFARITREVDAELAEAKAEESARLDLGKPRKVSWRAAWRGLLASEARNEARAWLAAAAERGPAIASIAIRRAQMRDEAARRLGLARADDGATAAPSAALHDAAIALLASTDDVARACLREARARAGLASEIASPVDAIAIGLGREATEGWPAQLAPRWLDATVGHFAKGLRIDLAPLPAALGASSFARALGAFGHALRVAGASPSLPFAVARDPFFASAHRFGALFASLPSSPAFQRRVLGNGARIAASQARVLARTALFDARLQAARFLLARDAVHDQRDRLEETSARLFDAPVPPSLAGAWPLARDDEAARLLALLTTLPLARALVDRFDEDWFANPRAVLHLRALASAPACEDDPAPDLAAAAAALTRAFEEALG